MPCADCRQPVFVPEALDEHGRCSGCTLFCDDCGEVVATADAWGRGECCEVRCEECAEPCEAIGDSFGRGECCREFCDCCGDEVDARDSFGRGGCCSVTCVECGETVEAVNVFDACNDCRVNCDHCGDDILGDFNYCFECSEGLENSVEGVHSYGYRPDPFFHDSRPRAGGRAARPETRYFGVEIETEWPGGVEDVTCFVGDETDWYAKEDSSLGDGGCEFVSHPRTLESWLADEPHWRALVGAEEAGGKAASRERCGMHVHISRRSVSRLMQAKFDWLLMDDLDESERFAYRKLGYFCEPARSRQMAATKAKAPMSVGRYQAVNAQPENTLEIRMFRSTLNPDVVRKRLATLHLLLEFVRNCAIADATWERFHGWLATEEPRRHVPRMWLDAVRERQGVEAKGS